MGYQEIFEKQKDLRQAEAILRQTPFLNDWQVQIGKLLLKAGFEEAGVSTSPSKRLATLAFRHPEISGVVELYGGPNEWESRLECRLGATSLWWLTKATPEELFRVVKRLSVLDEDGIMLREK